MIIVEAKKNMKGGAFPLWEHSAKNTHDISLHDCSATRIFVDQHDLYFVYTNGFWIVANTEHNSNSQTLRTGKSQLRICNYDISDIYIFKKISLFHRLINTRRVSLSLETLIKNINCGKWKLEFIDEYHTSRGVLFTCWIWSKYKPYHRECQLIIDCDDMEYLWNTLCEDKPW